MTSVPAIVLGPGITALGVLRTLSRAGIEAYLVETENPLLRRSRWFRPLPTPVPIERRHPLERWLGELPFPRAVLIPCTDLWTREAASLDPALRDRFPASVGPREQIDDLVDKGRFDALLARWAVPRPETFPLREVEDLDRVPDRFLESAFLKPRNSQLFFARFGVKAFRVGSRAEAREEFSRAAAAGLQVVLQYYVPGPATNHFFVDGFVDRHGVERAVFVRQRLRMYPPLFGNSSYMKSVYPDAARPAVDSLRRLLHGVQYRGIFSAEFKLDEHDGRFKLLEINARAWWYVGFAAQCGVDVARMAYDDALGLPIQTISEYATGRRCVYPYYDYFACQILRRAGQMSNAAMLASWLGAHQPVFQWRDPRPGVAAASEVLLGWWRARRTKRARAAGG